MEWFRRIVMSQSTNEEHDTRQKGGTPAERKKKKQRESNVKILFFGDPNPPTTMRFFEVKDRVRHQKNEPNGNDVLLTTKKRGDRASFRLLF